MKHYLTIVLLIASVCSQAQNLPPWYEASSRSLAYPSDVYITGFAMQKLGNGESLEKALSSVTEKARVNAIATIQVRIENETEDRLAQLQHKGTEGTKNAMQRYLQSVTRSSVDMEVSGLKFETCHDVANGRVAGFAYIKKAELIRQTDRKLTQILSKIETSMDQIDQLISNGQKLQARDLAQKTLPQFVEVDELQKLLAAADEEADEESLQLQEARNLQRRLIDFVAQLKNGIKIHIASHAFLFDSSYSELSSQIKGCLSDLGCEFVSNVDKSDWAINIISKPYILKQVSEYSFGCRLNTTMKITNTTTGKCVYEARVYNDAGMDVKGVSVMSNEDASIEAYKNLSPIVCDIIKKQIQQ